MGFSMNFTIAVFNDDREKTEEFSRILFGLDFGDEYSGEYEVQAGPGVVFASLQEGAGLAIELEKVAERVQKALGESVSFELSHTTEYDDTYTHSEYYGPDKDVLKAIDLITHAVNAYRAISGLKAADLLEAYNRLPASDRHDALPLVAGLIAAEDQ